MPSGVQQSKQICGNAHSSSSTNAGSTENVLSTSPFCPRTIDPLAHTASILRPVKPRSPMGNTERPVAGTTCAPSSPAFLMAPRIVRSASCRAFSRVPSKSLANNLIMRISLAEAFRASLYAARAYEPLGTPRLRQNFRPRPASKHPGAYASAESCTSRPSRHESRARAKSPTSSRFDSESGMAVRIDMM